MIVPCRLRHRFEYKRKSVGEERKRPLPSNGQFLVRQFSAFSGPFSLNRNESCCTRNRPSQKKQVNYLDYLRMLFDEVLSQYFIASNNNNICRLFGRGYFPSLDLLGCLIREVLYTNGPTISLESIFFCGKERLRCPSLSTQRNNILI